MLKFWSVNCVGQVCKLYYMSEILDNIHIWVLLVNSECVLLLAVVKYTLCSHFTQNCIFFFESKNRCFVTKNCWKFLIFAYLFSPKNGVIDFSKILIFQKTARLLRELHLQCSMDWCAIYVLITNFGLKCLLKQNFAK